MNVVHGSYWYRHAVSPLEPGELDCSGLSVVDAGEHQAGADYRVGPRVIGFYCFLVVMQGTGELGSASQPLPLKPGTSFMLFPYSPHCWAADAEAPLRLLYVAFTGEDAPSIVRSLHLSPHKPLLNLGTRTEVAADIITATIATLERPHGVHAIWDCRALLWQLLSVLLQARCADQTPPASHRSQVVTGAIDLIETQYAHRWTVADIAAAVHVSPSRLHSLFREEVGRSPRAYLNEIRVGHAATLLTATNLDIGEIGKLVGFPDAAHFSRVFRRHAGEAPSVFRRKWPPVREAPPALRGSRSLCTAARPSVGLSRSLQHGQ